MWLISNICLCQQVQWLLTMLTLVLALAQSTWVMLAVLVVRPTWLTAPIVLPLTVLVVTQKVQEYDVKVWKRVHQCWVFNLPKLGPEVEDTGLKCQSRSRKWCNNDVSIGLEQSTVLISRCSLRQSLPEVCDHILKQTGTMNLGWESVRQHTP